MEEVMSEIKEALSFELFYLLYADDLVCIVDYTQVGELIDTLFSVSERYSLIVNPKKCGIINVRKHEKLTTENLHGIPIVKEYRYLGVVIDQNGTVAPQL